MSTPIAVHLISLTIQIALLPLVVLVLPLVFVIAWAQEVIGDLARHAEQADS